MKGLRKVSFEMNWKPLFCLQQLFDCFKAVGSEKALGVCVCAGGSGLPEAQCGEVVWLDGSEGGEWDLYAVASSLRLGRRVMA